jgi:SAM-dependent methyltransferase
MAALSPRDLRTVVGHSSHDLMSPLSEAALDALVEHLGRLDGLLDVGSGKAAFARRVLLRERARVAVCVERNAVLAALGKIRAGRDGVAPRLSWIVDDAAGWRSPQRFDGVAVIGSSHALGGRAGTLAFAAEHLGPGGTLVLGEGVWVASPPAEYLRFLGTDGSETPTPGELEAALRDGGFEVVHRHRSTEREWAAYEGPYLAALAVFVADDGRRPYAAWARSFGDMQARYGRASMGFEAVVARVG